MVHGEAREGVEGLQESDDHDSHAQLEVAKGVVYGLELGQGYYPGSQGQQQAQALHSQVHQVPLAHQVLNTHAHIHT